MKLKIIENLKARLYCKPFDMYNEKIISNPRFKINDGKYWIYKDQIYFGHPLSVFFKSNQKAFSKFCQCENPVYPSDDVYYCTKCKLFIGRKVKSFFDKKIKKNQTWLIKTTHHSK